MRMGYLEPFSRDYVIATWFQRLSLISSCSLEDWGACEQDYSKGLQSHEEVIGYIIYMQPTKP